MTRVIGKRMYPDTLSECGLCSKGEEDCKHMFFGCLFTHTIWASEITPSVDATCELAFWDSIWQCGSGRKEEEGGWWLHWNEVLFREDSFYRWSGL